MTAYLIVYGLDPTDRFATYLFPTREAARLAEKSLVPSVPVDGYGRHAPSREARPGVGGCGYLIEKEEDVVFSGNHLVSIYNALTGGAVKKFESRAVGVKRLMATLAEKATPGPQPAEPAITNEEKKMSDTPKRRGKPASIAQDAVITHVAENPKRAGSSAHTRFSLYQVGMTVAEYEAAGGAPGDVRDDEKRGHIKVQRASMAAA